MSEGTEQGIPGLIYLSKSRGSGSVILCASILIGDKLRLVGTFSPDETEHMMSLRIKKVVFLSRLILL